MDYIDMVSELSDEWDDEVVYQPSSMGMAALHWLVSHCRGQARHQYTRFGAQLMDTLFLQGLVTLGYERGLKVWYLSPLGFSTYMKYVDLYFEKLDKAKKAYYSQLRTQP